MDTVIKIGCDPEFFVKKDGQLVSAHNLIHGTKKEPAYVAGGAVQVDGMALEFNIDPAQHRADFVNNIERVLSTLRKIVPNDYEFDFSPVAHFGLDYIEAQPKEAKELGCEPDYNAYTGDVNPKPNAETPFRTASGHIHIGWTQGEDPYDPEHFEACRMLVKQLDATIGVAQSFWDDDTTRRQLYGMPGAFRPKSYGVEYRVLSNAWLKDNSLRGFVFSAVESATQQLMDGVRFYEKEDYLLPELTWDQRYMFGIDPVLKNLPAHIADYMGMLYRNKIRNRGVRSIKLKMDNKIQLQNMFVQPINNFWAQPAAEMELPPVNAVIIDDVEPNDPWEFLHPNLGEEPDE